MLQRLCAILALFYLAAAAPAKAEVPAVAVGKVFRADDGTKLEIAYFEKQEAPTKDDRKVLIRIANSGTNWDGKVLEHSVREYDGKADFAMIYAGERWVSIAQRDFHGFSGWTTLFVEMPGWKHSRAMTFDVKSSEAFDPKTLLKGVKPAK